MQTLPSQWCNLPCELLHKISYNHLDTHLDFLRFRAICSSWRLSSSPPSRSLLPSKLPFPLDLHDFNPTGHTHHPSLGYYRLTQTIVYLIQPNKTTSGLLMHQDFEIKKTASTSSGTSGATSWLVKLEEVEDGSNKFRVFSPVSDSLIKNVGMEINLLDFRFVEVCKAYHLSYFDHSQKHARIRRQSVHPKKVLFFPGVEGEYTVVALNGDTGLYYVRNGDEEWTKFGFQIEHIVDYNGRLYSVDSDGYTSIYDSSYVDQTLISGWSGGYGCGRKIVLLENCGRLFLVDIGIDVDPCTYDYDIDPYDSPRSFGSEYHTAVRMKIYCLDEEKHKWEIVKSLGDRIMFLGNDCSFSVSATNFAGCEGNVVYHGDQGIELQFGKEKPKVYNTNGYDEFGDHQSHDEPFIDEFACYDLHNYWIDHMDDDEFACYDLHNYWIDHMVMNDHIDDEFACYDLHNYWIDHMDDDHIDDEFGADGEPIDDEFSVDDEAIDDEFGRDDEPFDDEFGGNDEPIDDECGIDDEAIDDEFGGDDEPFDDVFGADGKYIGDKFGGDDEPIDDEFGVDDKAIDDEPSDDEFGGDDKHIGDEFGGDDEPIDDEFGVDDEAIDGEFGGDEPIDDEFGGYDHNYWMYDCSSSDGDFSCVPRKKAHSTVKGASDDVLKGLQGQNIGVFDVQTHKLGSLLMFREGASIFWPPPAWLKNNQN